MLRAAVLALICALPAFAAVGCGGGASGSGDTDPTSMVPAGVPVYIEASVRPEGELRENALAAAGKLLSTPDPAGRLRELLDEQLAEEVPGASWERDLAPWLGEKAGVWVSGLDQQQPTVAAIIASTDADAARAAIERLQKAGGGTRQPRTYKEVTYTLDGDGTAVGVVDDWVVTGTESGFKRTVDEREGDHLDGVERYTEAVDALEEDRLGHYYVDPRGLLDAARKQNPSATAQLDQFKSLFPVDKLGPITGAFTADGEGMAFDTVISDLPDGPMRRLAALAVGGQTELLESLPGDAWGAFATPAIGEALEELVNSFAGALGGAALTAQLQQATGLDLQRDLLAWMGDLGVFVRGTTEQTVDGALVVTSRDDERAATAFGKLAGLLGRQTGTKVEPVSVAGAESAFEVSQPGSTQRVYLARAEGRVVAAVGKDAATAALDPKSKLADSAVLGQAKDVLGDGNAPSFVLAMPSVLALVEAMGETDADYAEAKPYLETIGVIAGGGSTEDDDVRSRVAAGFR